MMVQVPPLPGIDFPLQVSVSAKSPLTVRLVILSAVAPVLVRVTV